MTGLNPGAGAIGPFLDLETIRIKLLQLKIIPAMSSLEELHKVRQQLIQSLISATQAVMRFNQDEWALVTPEIESEVLKVFPDRAPFDHVIPNSEPWYAAILPSENLAESDKIKLYRVIAFGVDKHGTTYPITPRPQMSISMASREQDVHEIMIYYYPDKVGYSIELSIKEIEEILDEKLDWDFIRS